MSKGEKAVVVQSSVDLYKIAQGAMPEVTVIHVTANEISEFVSKQDPWKDVKDAPGISKVHVLACCDGENIEMFRNDADTEVLGTVKYGNGESEASRQSIALNLKPGDWAMVRYEGENFPGELLAIHGSGVEVSVMKPARRGKWYWPVRPDIFRYEPAAYVLKLKPPVSVGMVGEGGKEDIQYEFWGVL